MLVAVARSAANGFVDGASEEASSASLARGPTGIEHARATLGDGGVLADGIEIAAAVDGAIHTAEANVAETQVGSHTSAVDAAPTHRDTRVACSTWTNEGKKDQHSDQR